ncbi:hypothetical protein Btru_029707 [Bulinus truncatus]|nr:hypothetical protein Btru_029707 [Bulinus truncatus]
MNQCQRQVAEELSREIRQYDQSRDLPLKAGLVIGAFSVATSAVGVLSSFAVHALSTYRSDVDAFWLTCTPFIFPVITGIATTYRRQFSNIGIHICLLLATLIVGCVGYGFSIEPVYMKMDNCTEFTRESYHGNDCRKESLVLIYLAAGGATIGLNICGLIASLVACYIALRRRAQRLLEKRNQELVNTERANESKKHSPIYKVDGHSSSSSDPNKKKDDAIVLLNPFDI